MAFGCYDVPTRGFCCYDVPTRGFFYVTVYLLEDFCGVTMYQLEVFLCYDVPTRGLLWCYNVAGAFLM